MTRPTWPGRFGEVPGPELKSDPTPAFVNAINRRTARIGAELETRQAALRRLRETTPTAPCPELLDHCPIGTIDSATLPEPTLRRLLDAFAVRMRHDKEHNRVEIEVTITPEMTDTRQKAANAAMAGGGNDDRAAMLVYPLPDSNRRYRLERAAS